jgi:hypothetical protein
MVRNQTWSLHGPKKFPEGGKVMKIYVAVSDYSGSWEIDMRNEGLVRKVKDILGVALT